MKYFEIPDLDHGLLYLRIKFNKLCNKLFISQCTHVFYILKEFNIEKCIPSLVLMIERLKLEIKEESPKVDKK